MRAHEEEEGEGDVVVDSEEGENEETGADFARPFARETGNVGGCSSIDATVGDKLRLDERELIGVSYVGTEVPGECSQADAFDVIEHLAVLDDMEMIGGVDSANVVKENSPCLLTVKGVHNLARRIGLTRLARDMGRFEWVDGNRCKELKDGNWGSGRKRSKIKCMDAISEADALGSESRYEAEVKYQGSRSVEASAGESEVEFIMDLDRNLDVEASGLRLDAYLVDGATKDDCDVGVATQMAAEAMEALSHAPSSSSCSSFSPGLQTYLIPKPQSCYGSSSMKTRSCSESASLTGRSKEIDNLPKRSGRLERDSGRSSSTIFRQSIGKRSVGINKRTKQKNAALVSPTSSEYTMQHWTEKEANHDIEGTVSVKGWSRSKGRLGRIIRRYPGENVEVDVNIVGKVGRSEGIVGETDLFVNSQRFKHLKLSPTLDSWCYPKRKRTRIDSRRLSSGAVDPQLYVSRTLFKNKLNGNGSKREASPSQNTLGTLTICLNNDEGVFAMQKAKRSCPRGACSINNLLPQDKTMAIGSSDCAKFLMKSEVEDTKDQHSPKNLDGYIKNMTLKSLDSTGSGDLKTMQDKKHPNTFWLRELKRLEVSNVGPDYKQKDLRKQRHMAYVRVLLSLHLEEVVIRQQKKMMLRMAIPMATSMDDATHFVADKFVRTRNMLEAIALGKPVVTPLWLDSCLQAGYLIAEKNFILRDEKMEKKLAFDLPSSLERARRCPLLEGKKVVITPNIGPDKEMILRLIDAVHGQAIETSDPTEIKDENSIDELLVLSCSEDCAVYSHFLKMGVAVYSSELLLNGIVTQKIDYERYLLLGSEVGQACRQHEVQEQRLIG